MMSPNDARSYVEIRLDFAERYLRSASVLPASKRRERYDALMHAIGAAEEAHGAANVAGGMKTGRGQPKKVRMLSARALEVAAEARSQLSKVCFPHRRKPRKKPEPDPAVLAASQRAIDRYTRGL